MSEELSDLEVVPPSHSDSIERASIDVQVATARKYGRSLSRVKQEMLSFATLDEETAQSCFFTLPRGGKTIQGPSVRLAEIAVACYEHLRVQARIVTTVTTGESPHVIVQAQAYDALKNSAISIEKRRRIVKKKSKETIDDDDITLATNSCTAIAFRDAVFKIVPKALITPVYEEAKRVAIGDVKSLGVRRTKVVERLKAMGATEPNILHAVGARKVEDITLEHLETLIGLGTSLKDGATTIEEAFPGPKIEPAQFVGKVEKNEKPKETVSLAPQMHLESFSVQECKTYFDAFASIVKEAAAYESFADMPNELCETLLKDKKALKLRLGGCVIQI